MKSTHGWSSGTQEFAKNAPDRARELIGKGKSRADRRSRECLAHGEKEAERLFAERLVAAGLWDQGLAKLPANEKRKVEIAREIWRRTTVSQGWIAERLKFRQTANVSLARHRLKGADERLAGGSCGSL